MNAAYINRYGSNDVIEIGDLPRPPIGLNDLLVQVKAASVNPLDFKITIYGVPTAKVGREWGLNSFVRAAMWFMNRRQFALAQRHSVRYEYLFMRPSGEQLSEIATLLDSGKIVPVIDRVFPLAQARDAFAYSESGRAVGKIIITP